MRAACLQMRTGQDVAANRAEALALITQAAEAGAEFVLTPEMTLLMELDRARLTKGALREGSAEDFERDVKPFCALAAARKIWLVIGSLAVARADGRFANRSFVIDPTGAITATYDKIHMFDVTVSETERYRESATYERGDRAVVVPTPWGGVGLSICYDLRFPQLYQALVRGGADLLLVPAAFTKATGEAHWHTLLRARAIETGAFVLAAAQGGTHENGRQTYGHALVVDPWGEILSEGGEEPGVVLADLDLARVASARRRIPAWQGSPFFTTGLSYRKPG